MKSNLLIISIGSFLLALTATAQDQAQAQAQNVNTLIDVVAWGDDIQGLSLGKPPGGEELVHAQAFRYGEPVKYQGSQLLAIYQSDVPQQSLVFISAEEEKEIVRPLNPLETKTPAADGEIPKHLAERRKLEPNLVALVSLPANSRRITLLLAPGPQKTFQGYVIDDDPTRLPVGKLRVHNLSSNEVALHFGGGKKRQLKPQESFFVEAKENFMTYRLAYLLENKWKIQESNVLPLRSNEQCQMFILRSDNPFFLSSDGSRNGYMQMVILRRQL